MKPNGHLCFSLSQPLCSTLSWTTPSGKHMFPLRFMTPSSPGSTATSLGFPPVLLCYSTSPLGSYAGHGPRPYSLLTPHSQMRNLFQAHGFSCHLYAWQLRNVHIQPELFPWPPDLRFQPSPWHFHLAVPVAPQTKVIQLELVIYVPQTLNSASNLVFFLNSFPHAMVSMYLYKIET